MKEHFTQSGGKFQPKRIRTFTSEQDMSVMNPTVSIVIPVKNNLHFTVKCLESIASSPPKTAYEIILVDNASDDGTREFLEEKVSQGELQSIRNDPPRPFAASCNRGAEASLGKYLVFLNNDTEAFSCWLDALVEVAERSGHIGAVGAKLLFPDGTIQHAGVAFRYFKRLRQYGPYHIFRLFPRNAPAVNKEREFKCVTGACLLTPKELFIDSGGFDERFINCFEDVDYCLRIKQMGYKIIYTPRAELIHYEGQTTGRKDNEIHSDRILRQKWGDQMRADELDYLEEEGFVIEEDEKGQVTIFPGKELQEWWKVINQLMELKQYRMVLEEIVKIEGVIGGNHRNFQVLRGRCQSALGDFGAARAAYARAQSFDPKDPDIKWDLVQLAMAEGKWENARILLKRLLQNNPEDNNRNKWERTLERLSSVQDGGRVMPIIPEGGDSVGAEKRPQCR